MKTLDKVASYTTEEFLKLELPPKEPLIKDLLHRRDLVTFAGRRRHGKTTFLVNLCVATASQKELLGYKIPEPRRSLMLLLEDDPRELQDKVARVTNERDTEGRIRIVTREDFYEAQIPIDIKKSRFKEVVQMMAKEHNPDLIVIDNLAHVIGARYNDPELIQLLMVEVYKWAKNFDSAVILAAHPRKEDINHPVRLDKEPEGFFETVMGSSHLVNSTGSLWGLQRCDSEGYSVFLGGRQRGDGQQGFTLIEKGDDDWYRVLPDTTHALELVNHTRPRKKAWDLLPETFGYREGEEAVREALSSSSSFHSWHLDLKRNGLIVLAGKKWKKAAGK